jgi:fatty acid synthesis protein
VERAGIVTQLPNEFGVCNVTDTGANPDAKPRHLVGYAVMASILARSVYGKPMPKVGVMSNGSEDEKGTDFTKGTFCLLKHLEERGALPFKFVGNVEGHDLFEHEIDVALTDGFTGNVLLKTCEATAKAFGKWLKEELQANPLRMMGAACASGAFRAMKARLSADSVGGSPLLGVRGVTIIAHGSSTPVAIRNALRVSMEMVQQGVNPLIEEEMARLGTIPEVSEVYPK